MSESLTKPVMLDARIAQWALLWKAPGLETRVSVSFSRRLRRSLGRCVPARGVVRLNMRLLRSRPELLDEVLCHEVAHVAAYELHGRRTRPHGREWAALMRAAGFEPRVRTLWRHDVVAAAARRPRRGLRYEHRCPVCQTGRLARRPVRQWRCAACVRAGLDGRLVITKRNGVRRG